MTFIIVLAFLLVVVAIAAAVSRSGEPSMESPPRSLTRSAGPAPDDFESPTELSLRDPVEALRRYGTTADAERLIGEGVDLSALGYRPPD